MLELIKEENVEVGVHAADWRMQSAGQHSICWRTGKIEDAISVQ